MPSVRVAFVCLQLLNARVSAQTLGCIMGHVGVETEASVVALKGASCIPFIAPFLVTQTFTHCFSRGGQCRFHPDHIQGEAGGWGVIHKSAVVADGWCLNGVNLQANE